ncbi:DUF1572 domain-containing protein [Portibacter lacus]|uniref:DUF1572 domain-containing protein n=1 Tax=Portibacter lacus TaxID=1099794 RepID=A0AA37STU0_9BACT|nr:DUF1572 domain-containing protein [Portibacter lacus]GLR19494.1 hypothetical protein GCM10007940_41100 [Portibacter lacus]
MNKITTLIGKQFHDAYLGKNWTAVNLKDTLADVSWEESITQVYGLNTIATLVFHMNYYVKGVTAFLQGKPLSIKDKFSFECPIIASHDDWIEFMNSVWLDAEVFTALVSELPDDRMFEEFADYQYGSYFRNLCGITEHIHYHLGQIVMLKKIIRQQKSTAAI